MCDLGLCWRSGMGVSEEVPTQAGVMTIQEGFLEEVATEVQGGMGGALGTGHLACKNLGIQWPCYALECGTQT